jgi:hypothetical protein
MNLKTFAGIPDQLERPRLEKSDLNRSNHPRPNKNQKSVALRSSPGSLAANDTNAPTDQETLAPSSARGQLDRNHRAELAPDPVGRQSVV